MPWGSCDGPLAAPSSAPSSPFPSPPSGLSVLRLSPSCSPLSAAPSFANLASSVTLAASSTSPAGLCPRLASAPSRDTHSASAGASWAPCTPASAPLSTCASCSCAPACPGAGWATSASAGGCGGRGVKNAGSGREQAGERACAHAWRESDQRTKTACASVCACSLACLCRCVARTSFHHARGTRLRECVCMCAREHARTMSLFCNPPPPSPALLAPRSSVHLCRRHRCAELVSCTNGDDRDMRGVPTACGDTLFRKSQYLRTLIGEFVLTPAPVYRTDPRCSGGLLRCAWRPRRRPSSCPSCRRGHSRRPAQPSPHPLLPSHGRRRRAPSRATCSASAAGARALQLRVWPCPPLDPPPLLMGPRAWPLRTP